MTKHVLTLEFPDKTSLLAYLMGTAASIGAVATGTTTAADASGGDDDEGGPVNANAPAVDKAGFPWDERIHSSNRAMNKDGTWRGRRNVPPETVRQVEAELTARVSGAAPIATQPGQMMPTNVQAMPSQPVQAPQMTPAPQTMPMQPAQPQMMPAGQPMPGAVPTAMPSQPMQQTAPVQPSGPDLHTFMQSFAKGMTTPNPITGAPYITQDYLARILEWRQVSDITQIQAQPGGIEAVIQQMKTDNAWID